MKTKGRLDLSRHESALAGGKAIVPGKSADSPMWQLVESDEMPDDRPPLSADEKRVLKDWLRTTLGLVMFIAIQTASVIVLAIGWYVDHPRPSRLLAFLALHFLSVVVASAVAALFWGGIEPPDDRMVAGLPAVQRRRRFCPATRFS